MIEELIRSGHIDRYTPQARINILLTQWSDNALAHGKRLSCTSLRGEMRTTYHSVQTKAKPVVTPRALVTKFQSMTKGADDEQSLQVCEGVLPIIEWGIAFLRQHDRDALIKMLKG